MKMVKSLLLGSAAGLVAVAGAQAADLPVKAKPVQYVKICSLYGAGFYYIPGTDMCLKIGGWVRAEYAYGDNGNFAWGWAAGNANSRNTNNSVMRARGYITADARNQTPYGTVRAYIAVGLSTNDTGLQTAANQFSANRAFLQWAGFTFGVAQSFYDFYSVPASSLWGAFPASDTGDPGWTVFGYTAQFGNGLSATISAEARRMTQIENVSGGAAGGSVAPGSFPSALGGAAPLAGGAGVGPGAGAYGGFQAPDIIGNLRIDQAWGSAQIMAAYHEVNANYYGLPGGAAAVGNGHPSDEAGFALGAGIKILAPMIGKGDYFQAQFNYTDGATRYIMQTPNSNWGKVDGASEGFGVVTDAVYGGGLGTTASGNGGATSLQLTTAWGVNAAYDHYWNPSWKTSLYGGYAEVDYNSSANAMLCSGEGAANFTGTVGAGTVAAVAGCNNDWSTWWLGSRTQWNVTSDLYLALDVLYSKIQSASLVGGVFGAGTPVVGGSACVVATVCTVADQDNWTFRFRVHKDFYP